MSEEPQNSFLETLFVIFMIGAITIFALYWHDRVESRLRAAEQQINVLTMTIQHMIAEKK